MNAHDAAALPTLPVVKAGPLHAILAYKLKDLSMTSKTDFETSQEAALVQGCWPVDQTVVRSIEPRGICILNLSWMTRIPVTPFSPCYGRGGRNTDGST